VAPAGAVSVILQRPDTNAQDHSSVADYVQGAVTLGDFERMVVGQDQLVCGEPDPLEKSSDVAERGEWIPVPRTASGQLG
jgi:hypothetical protein